MSYPKITGFSNFPKITKIPHQICPHCRAEPISTRVDQKHSCGDWNEYVSYRCGLILHWSPNFQAMVEEKSCETQCQMVEVTVPLHLTLRLPKEVQRENVVIDINKWGWNFVFSLLDKNKNLICADRGKHRIELVDVRTKK